MQLCGPGHGQAVPCSSRRPHLPRRLCRGCLAVPSERLIPCRGCCAGGHPRFSGHTWWPSLPSSPGVGQVLKKRPRDPRKDFQLPASCPRNGGCPGSLWGEDSPDQTCPGDRVPMFESQLGMTKQPWPLGGLKLVPCVQPVGALFPARQTRHRGDITNWGSYCFATFFFFSSNIS